MSNRLGAAASLAAGYAGFVILARTAGSDQIPPGSWPIGLVLAVAVLAFWMRVSWNEPGRVPIGLFLLGAAGWTLALSTLVHLLGYVLLPVDLLSFAESGFITDIIEFRSGQPLFTPPQDNSAIVYTPGAPILTYLIARLFGGGDSIPFLRSVQFGYVVLAAMVATSALGMLTRILSAAPGLGPMWRWAAAPFLFLVATDPRFNLYVPSLHNDGLALLVSISCYWLMLRYCLKPRRWVLAAMGIVPALGFLVKQNQVMWAGLFLVFLAVSGLASRRELGWYLAGAGVAVAAVVGWCWFGWGPDFQWWVFTGLGAKSPSPVRMVQHLFQAGLYLGMGAVAGWAFVLQGGSRVALALWTVWVLLCGIQIWTSGYAWVVNHLGAGVLIAACWFFVWLVRIWPQFSTAGQQVFAAITVVVVLGSLGFDRDPRNPVPPDFDRYMADISQELGGSMRDVLMDWGSWPYMRENIVMKDRALSVAVHAGDNQREVNHAMLAATIGRIERKTYRKILVRNYETSDNFYDFNRRGTGVRQAMEAHYRVARRIPGVRGINQWWPIHLVQEVTVLVPREAVR